MKLSVVLLSALLLTPNILSAQKWNWNAPDTAINISTENEPTSLDSLIDENQKNTDVSTEMNVPTFSNASAEIPFTEDDFDKADANKDGIIEEDELLQYQQNNFMQMVQQTFNEFDTNKDGKISEEEILSYYSKQQLDEQTLKKLSERFSEADMDKNNYLDEFELRHFLQKDLNNNNKMIFQLFDSNGDNRITREEMSQIINLFKNLYH